MTTVEEINTWLDSIIETADYLRSKVAIPENADFRDAIFPDIKDADSTLGSVADMVNDYDENEWA